MSRKRILKRSPARRRASGHPFEPSSLDTMALDALNRFVYVMARGASPVEIVAALNRACAGDPSELQASGVGAEEDRSGRSCQRRRHSAAKRRGSRKG
jgi:hypothetical protein